MFVKSKTTFKQKIKHVIKSLPIIKQILNRYWTFINLLKKIEQQNISQTSRLSEIEKHNVSQVARLSTIEKQSVFQTVRLNEIEKQNFSQTARLSEIEKQNLAFKKNIDAITIRLNEIEKQIAGIKLSIGHLDIKKDIVESIVFENKKRISLQDVVHYSAYTNGNAGDNILVKALQKSYNVVSNNENVYANKKLRDTTTINDVNNINKSQSVFVGGGGLFLKDTNPNDISGWQWPCSKELIEKIDVPLFVLSVGYNRFRNQDDFDDVFKENINSLVEKAAFFGLRNSGSVNAIKSYLQDDLKHKVSFHPCPTTILSRIYPKSTAKANKPFIAVNCAFDRSDKRFPNGKETILNSITSVLLELNRVYDIKYYVHMESDKEILSVFDKFKLKYEIVQFNRKDITTQDFIDLYSMPELVIGMRGHAQLIPFGCETPILSIISHDKLQWFLEDIQHTEWGVDVTDVKFEQKLLEQANYILTNKIKVKTELQIAQNYLWKITQENLNFCKAEINKYLFQESEKGLENGQYFIKNNRGVNLTGIAEKVKGDVQNKFKNNVYKTVNIDCVCGSTQVGDVVELAIEDRYSMPLRTVICKKCGLVRSTPYFDSKSLNEFYTYEYDKIYRGHLNIDSHFKNRIRAGYEIMNSILPFVKSINGKIIYEIGCSFGGILSAFKETGAIVKGVDYGVDYLEYGKGKGLDLYKGSIEVLEKFEKADMVIINHVLEHTIDVIDFLVSIKKVLKTDGVLYVSVPTIETIPSKYGSDIYKYVQNAHVWNFSNKTLQYVLECSGYNILFSHESGYCVCRPSDTTKKMSDFPNTYEENLSNLITYEDNYLSLNKKEA